MEIKLSRSYRGVFGTPVIDRFDPNIFKATYYMSCMKCGFCEDICCSYGVDVDVENVKRLKAVAEELEPRVGVPSSQWFTDVYTDDPEFPGGKYTRTAVKDGRCVFLNRKSRGCHIHSYCLEKGVDYHEVKPMVSILFPLTFDGGLLHPSNEINDQSLVCLGNGPSLYDGVRDDLCYYFGDELVSELDHHAAALLEGT